MHDPRKTSNADPSALAPSASPLPRGVWLAYVSGAFGLAVTAQINFLVPLRARELGASFDVVGLLVGVGALAPSLLAVTSGAVIDHLGARRTFVIGTASTAVVASFFALVTSYWGLLLLQPVLGVVRNLAWLASQTYITGLGAADERHAIAGRFAFFTNASQVAAPVLTGAVAQLVGFRWAFLFLAAYSAAFSLMGLLLPRAERGDSPAPRGAHGTGLRSALQMLALPTMQTVLLLSGVRLWVTWIYTAFVPTYLVDHGLPPAAIGTVLATYGIVATIVAPATGFLARFAGGPTVATAGLGCGTLALLAAPHFVTVPLVYLPPALIGVGHGVSLPVLLTLIAGAAPPGMRGIALGLRGAINQGTAAAGPILIGCVISAVGILPGLALGAVTAAVMLAGARARQTLGDGEQNRSRPT